MKTMLVSFLVAVAVPALALDEWVWLDYQTTNCAGAASMSVRNRDDLKDLAQAGIVMPSQFPALIHVPSRTFVICPASIADAKAQLQGQRYVLDDQYLLLCDYLSNTNTHARLDIAGLQQLLLDIQGMDPAKEVTLFQYLVALQVALQQAGDVLWWETCVWHPQDWAVATAAANQAALFGAGAFAATPVRSAATAAKPLGIRLRARLKP